MTVYGIAAEIPCDKANGNGQAHSWFIGAQDCFPVSSNAAQSEKAYFAGPFDQQKSECSCGNILPGAGGHCFSRGDGVGIALGIGLCRTGSECTDKNNCQAQVKR